MNTRSGGGVGRLYLTVVEKHTHLKMTRKGETCAFMKLFDMCEESSRGRGLEEVKELVEAHEDVVVVVCGGDGTILWVVEEVLKTGVPVERVRFGVIPIGTGNDFSRSLGWGGSPVYFDKEDVSQLRKITKKWLKA